MLFTKLVLLIASASVSLAAPGTSSPEELSLPTRLLTRGVPLEFNRTYTEPELDELARALASRNVEKRAISSGTASVNGVFNCPHGGQISRSMRAEGAIISSKSNGAGTFEYSDLFNVDSWSFGDTLTFGIPPDNVDNTAIHHFCASYGNIICAYELSSSFEAVIEADNPPLGSSTPFIHTFDPTQPFLKEYCVQVTNGANSCPAFELAEHAGIATVSVGAYPSIRTSQHLIDHTSVTHIYHMRINQLLL
ncbi:unnamed protein product [Penicillium glandicola]